METQRLSIAGRDALLSLLDDTQPAVRQALVTHFTQHPAEGKRLLEETARGTNRILAWHARWFLRELKFDDPTDDFIKFIHSLHYELETGVILLSRTVIPETDAGECCAKLDEIAARVRELSVEPSSAREKCRVLNRVLFHEWGFRGNIEHYTDPLNSFLPSVLETRKGIPISLSVVYLLVARRLGIDLEPVGFPGHFMVGCYLDESPFFIDPFEKGVFREPAELIARIAATANRPPELADLAPVPVREVLCRICRNLVHHYEEAGNDNHAQLFARFLDEFETTYNRHSEP